MRLWLWPFKLIGLLLLAALLSGAWLLRREIYARMAPEISRISDHLREGHGAGAAIPEALDRARGKVDSLQGWKADSVLLSAREMAALIAAGLPAAARDRLDSIRVVLGDGRLTVAARLETTRIPAGALGPLAGALDPWEAVAAAGEVAVVGPGRAEWRVDALTLRGFTLPEPASRDLVARALPGAPTGAIPFALPEGIADLRVRSTGVALYRKER